LSGGCLILPGAAEKAEKSRKRGRIYLRVFCPLVSVSAESALEMRWVPFAQSLLLSLMSCRRWTGVLAEMSPRVTVTDTTRTDRPDWRRLSEAELDEQIELLVRCGDQWEAIGLLRRRRGCSTSEAFQLVGELVARI
jgi:hypothetical protein